MPTGLVSECASDCGGCVRHDFFVVIQDAGVRSYCFDVTNVLPFTGRLRSFVILGCQYNITCVTYPICILYLYLSLESK